MNGSYCQKQPVKRLQGPCYEGLKTAEAVSKRKITSSGGKYDLHFYWHVIKVGLEVFVADDSLPMWCAVPLTSKSRLF
jgi:hypothetical protein